MRSGGGGACRSSFRDRDGAQPLRIHSCQTWVYPRSVSGVFELPHTPHRRPRFGGHHGIAVVQYFRGSLTLPLACLWDSIAYHSDLSVLAHRSSFVRDLHSRSHVFLTGAWFLSN